MIRLVTEEMPTSATKMRTWKLAGGSRPPLLPFFSMPMLLTRPSGPVTHARHGLYDLRPRRVALDLGPQPAYVDVYVAAGRVVRARRDGLAYLGPREGLPRTAHEQRQYLELGGRELQRLPVPAHRVRPGVELQLPDPQHSLAPAALPPEPPQ